VNRVWPTVQDWVEALYIIVPIYCTNGAPVLFGGGPPVDLGKSLSDGERIFGGHKTIRGFASGLVVGGIVGVFEKAYISSSLLPAALLASLGALLGDLGGAFIKRRLKIPPGRSLPGIDQLDFVIGAVLLASTVLQFSLGSLLILFMVTPPIHFLANVSAYALGLKSNYW
jgi:CDP-2,3-bis-(O-geranylgeranyl)-sn-glycerol synthase